jgi:hypothetical protein
MPQYKAKQMEVIRRFRDFAWLHARLQEQNRGAHALLSLCTCMQRATAASHASCCKPE